MAEHTSVIDLHGRRGHPAYDPDLNPNVIYVGRYQGWGAGRILHGHPLGNPFGVKRYGLHESLVKYTDWFTGNPGRVALATTLRGKTLGCWCIDTRPACHALIVAAVADDRPDDIQTVLELARRGGA